MAELQNQVAAIKPEQILDIIIRRRWLIIIPLCITLTLGFIYSVKAPQTYKTSTTILIQPQRVPSNYVQSIISTDTGQRINTISQQILSRTNLEKIIEEFGLYQSEEKMYQEDKIKDMRKRIAVIQNSAQSRGTAAFTLSFSGDEPKMVMNVVNKIASLFMDENLKIREIQARGTSEFLESELEKIKKKLENREEALSIYRAKNMGGLPGELETNLRTLDRLQIQHTDALNSLRDSQNAAALLKNQISAQREMANNRTSLQPDGSFIASPNLSIAEQQYESEKRQLDELLLKYTNKHPEVVKLSKSVEKLKEKIEKENKENTASQSENPGAVMPNNSVLSQQQFSLRQIENEIKNIRSNILQIEKNMQVYQKRVDDTPKREQELQSIQRDYNNIRASYNSLLGRRLEAELSVNMEKKQKGEQFRILDYARLPEKPIKPDVRMLFLFSLAIGLGIGGGIIFLFEFLNPPIWSADQIETQTGLPVLASIPAIAKPGGGVKNIVEMCCFALLIIYASVFLLLFAAINTKGINHTMNFLKAYINI